jgi:FMN phosphatase YigB (HAD superfamily)
VPLLDDVLPVLSELSARMPLGLLSNGNGYPERSGLTGILTVVVFSDDHLSSKPDRRLFDFAGHRQAGRAGVFLIFTDSHRHRDQA